MVDIKKLFGQNLKKYRERKNLSQEEVAEYIGLDDKSISPIECGRSFISIKRINKLAEVLEIEPYQLFLPNDRQNPVNDNEKKLRIFSRLESCSKEELDLLCDILCKFLDK